MPKGGKRVALNIAIGLATARLHHRRRVVHLEQGEVDKGVLRRGISCYCFGRSLLPQIKPGCSSRIETKSEE